MADNSNASASFLGSSKRAWLKPFIEPLLPLFKEVVAVSLFVNLLALAVPIFVLQVYDRVVFYAGMTTLQGLVIGMLVVLAFDFILRQNRSKILQSVALRLDVSISRSLFEKIMAAPLQRLESHPAAYWQLLFRDVEVIRNTLSGASAVLITDLPFALVFLALFFVIAWPVAWVLVVIFLIFLGLAWYSGKIVAAAAEEEKAKIVSRDGLIAEIIMGRNTIKSLSMEDNLKTAWEDSQAAAIKQALVRGNKTDSFINAGQGLTMLTTVMITTVGAIAIMNQDLTIGGLIAANILSGRLLSPLNQLVGTWRNFVSFGRSAERLSDIFASQNSLQRSAVELKRPRGEITFEETTFRYNDNGPAIVDNIKLEIAPFGVTAIMGANGCGKTTLIKLLLGLYSPASGRVLLDGADIKQFQRRELARWIGYAPQECVLFNGTVRDNITHTKPNASDDEIVRATTLALAHEMLLDLPDGYGTQVGEGGALLSGGLRQRISIARALLGDPPVIVLDEPSGSLDKNAESNLQKSLTEIGKERTVIIVTHSPTLLQACNNVIIMDHGRIKASGPASEVMDNLAHQQNITGTKKKPFTLTVKKVDNPTNNTSTK
ncbi:MAG: peptidase domain-containing ABC transporter [Rhodospirillaceae bacterium]